MVWIGSLTRTKLAFRTAAGITIIDLFISMETTIINLLMDTQDMKSLSTHHHNCTFLFSSLTPWKALPTPN